MKPRAEGDEWPPHLAVFRASDWPPAAGDLDAGGPPRSARSRVIEAHHRWRRARLAMLTEGTLEHGVEQLRGLRENVALIRGIQPKGES